VNGAPFQKCIKVTLEKQQNLDKFSDHWSPGIIARLNDYHFKEEQ
jgi:hypothetical protein